MTPKKKLLRAKALHNLDDFLNWTLSERLKIYPLMHPLQAEEIRLEGPELREFAKKYGYFSEERPIVARVTSDGQDLQLVCDLLEKMDQYKISEKYLEIATAEILTKVLAYRDLKKDQIVKIPGKGDFVVEILFDIWHGMPAFGLTPVNKDYSPILLFRGTEFSLISQRGWASMMSDLDMAGPGLSAFHNAQDAIHNWLQEKREQGRCACVMGYSLGGALAAYTFIYENALIADCGSFAFNAPGVAEKVIQDWKGLSDEKKLGFVSYVNAGDVVSKVGKLFGTTYCLSTLDPLKPLTAHTMLMCGEPLIIKALVDTQDS